MTESNFGTLIDTRLRLVTWNLWWRFGPWEQRLPAIVETIRRLDADVICLQEVWTDPSGRSSASVIADALGWDAAAQLANEHRVEMDIEGEPVGFGNAVLSRWPITSSATVDLPSPPELEEFRLGLRADIDGPRGPLQVFTTHLHWRFDHSHIRQEQVKTLCRFIADSPDRSYPAILCGDFNADPEADEIRMLTGRAASPVPPLVFYDAWVMGGDGFGATWSNANPYAVMDLEPERRIDFVFGGFPKSGGAGNITHAELVGVDAIDGVVPSDHYGVLAELRY